MKTYKTPLLVSILLLGVIALSGLFFNTVSAEESTSTPAWPQISPLHKHIDLQPGARYSGDFTVSNVGSDTFTFSVYARPFSVVGEDYEHNYSSRTQYNQVQRWITFEQARFTLTAGESQVVSFSINVPEDATPSSQHAVIFAEPIRQNTEDEHIIRAIPSVGMRLIARVVGDAQESVAIIDYSVPTLYISLDRPNISATSKIKNSGQIDAEATYRFEVSPFFGGDPVFIEERTHPIYPASEFKHRSVWENTPLLGLFSVTYSVTVGDLVQSETHVVFVVPAWFLILVLVLLTIFVIWVMLKIKKRREIRSKLQL